MANEQNIIFYDSDCGFCQASIDWLLKRDTSDQLTSIPYQDLEKLKEFPEIDQGHANSGVQLITPEKKIFSDESAIASCLELLPNFYYRIIGHVIKLPGIQYICHVGYQVIAKNRKHISHLLGLDACKIPSEK